MSTEPQPPPPPQRPTPAGDSPFMSVISAVLFLYVGFGLGLEGRSGNALYDGSVAAFTWGARIVGIGLLLVAGLSYMRLPFADALDLGMAAIATFGCLAVGVIWLIFKDTTGVLLLLFGLLNASALRYAWQRWKRRPAATQDDAD